MRGEDTLKKGKNNVKMIILSVLSRGDCYGYQLSQLILEYSDNRLVIPEGSLYPALYSLEEEGYLSTEKRLVGKRMERVYYHIEDGGLEYLKKLKEDYFYMQDLINQVLCRSAEDERKYND